MAVIAVITVRAEQTGSITGFVADDSGATIRIAHVSIVRADSKTPIDGETDRSGYFRFSNLPPAVYSISISSPGFYSTRIERVQIIDGKDIGVPAVLGKPFNQNKGMVGGCTAHLDSPIALLEPIRPGHTELAGEVATAGGA